MQLYEGEVRPFPHPRWSGSTRDLAGGGVALAGRGRRRALSGGARFDEHPGTEQLALAFR